MRRNTTRTLPCHPSKPECDGSGADTGDGHLKARAEQGDNEKGDGRGVQGTPAFFFIFNSNLLIYYPHPLPCSFLFITHPLKHRKRAPKRHVFVISMARHEERVHLDAFSVSSFCPPFEHQPHVHTDVWLVFGCHYYSLEHLKCARNGAFPVYGLLPPPKGAVLGTFRCPLSFYPFPQRKRTISAAFLLIIPYNYFIWYIFLLVNFHF